jgi:predicted PurR-regulated permease PerM
MAQPSHEDYVVVERRVSATAVLLVMLMIMVFLNVTISIYYWQQLQELNSNIKILTERIRSLQRDIRDLSEALESYRAINALIELQMRSIVIKMLREMGFSEEEIVRLLERWYNITRSSAVSKL